MNLLTASLKAFLPAEGDEAQSVAIEAQKVTRRGCKSGAQVRRKAQLRYCRAFAGEELSTPTLAGRLGLGGEVCLSYLYKLRDQFQYVKEVRRVQSTGSQLMIIWRWTGPTAEFLEQEIEAHKRKPYEKKRKKNAGSGT